MTDQDDGSTSTRVNGSSYSAALNRLRPPEHGESFWTDLDARLADEPQLRLAPRAAIRPITQPPPVIDDRNLASSLAAAGPPRPRRSSRRLVIGAVLGVLALVLLASAIRGPKDDTATSGTTTTTDSSDGRTPTTGGRAAPPATTPQTTAAPRGQVEPNAKLEPAGVGPLRIGQTLGQLQAAGVAIQPDMSTYNGTGGRCYGAKVVGALDLEFRFKPPDGQRRAFDPTQGVLAAVGVESGEPTIRQSNTGIGLGGPQNAVLAAYGGNLDQRDNSFVPGGKIFRADAGNGLGIAYITDGQTVIGISVGQMDTIRFQHQCG